MTELHAHSTASDGRYSPADLVRLAADHGITTLAVTDHDTVAGLDEARAAAMVAGIEFWDGIELSVVAARERVHLLAYGFDPKHHRLEAFGKRLAYARKQRALAMLTRLAELGVPVSKNRALERAGGVLARPHIADEIVAAGGAVDAADAFTRWIADDAPAFVPLAEVASASAIRMIHEAGGVVVLAHPGHWTSHRSVVTLIAEGLDGFEARHPSHDASLVTYYQEMADRDGLIVTGGADFHGRYSGEEDRLGQFAPSEHRLGVLRERLLARKTTNRT